jgi:ACS family tartrate transporter-like MFS transporter
MTEPAPPASPEDPIAASALRKASWRLIPLIALGYGTAYMDRLNLSFAALQMNRDLHFSATVYGFGAGLFFLPYAVCEIPSNLLLCRFGARRWLARIMITWGFIAMAMIFVRTPLEFYAARFFLGMAEAGFFPGVLFYLMQWFPPHLHARTVTRFYVAYPLATVFMGSIAGALLNLQGRLHLAGWQWLFLVEALPAILLGLLFLRLLPDSPADAHWLTEPERQSILAGVEQNATYNASILPVFRDRRVWLLGIVGFSVLACNYALSFSAPSIVQKATGLGVTRVGFIIALLGLLSAGTMMLGGAYSDRTGERHWNIIPYFLLTAAGFLVCGLSTSSAAMVAGIATIMLSSTTFQGPFLSLLSTFFSGKNLAVCIAAFNAISILGGFVGPYWMGIAKDLTGNYQRGLFTMAFPMLLSAAIILYLRRLAHVAASAPAPVILPIADALDSPNL